MPEEETMETLRLKNKILTILVILMLIWQVIDFLRVNSLMDRVDNKASSYSVDSLVDRVKDIERDIEDVYGELWDKADKTSVNSQIDDVMEYCRNYCNNGW